MLAGVRGGDWRVVVVWVGLGWDGGCDRSASLKAETPIKVAVTPAAQEKQNDRAPTNVTVRRGGSRWNCLSNGAVELLRVEVLSGLTRSGLEQRLAGHCRK